MAHRVVLLKVRGKAVRAGVPLRWEPVGRQMWLALCRVVTEGCGTVGPLHEPRLHVGRKAMGLRAMHLLGVLACELLLLHRSQILDNQDINNSTCQR